MLSTYYMVSCVVVSVCMFQLMTRTSGIPDNATASQLVTLGYLISCEPMRCPWFAALTDATAAAEEEQPIRTRLQQDDGVRSCRCKSVIKLQPEISREAPKHVIFTKRFVLGTTETNLWQQCVAQHKHKSKIPSHPAQEDYGCDRWTVHISLQSFFHMVYSEKKHGRACKDPTEHQTWHCEVICWGMRS